MSEDLLYASLGGTKPDDSYSFDRLETLMRSLDKVGVLSLCTTAQVVLHCRT